jgi:2'-5' RNA ligase
MRLFAAIPVPESLRQRLHGMAKELFSGLDEGAKIRITPLENIHLTLFFAGECGPDEQALLGQAVREVAAQFVPWRVTVEDLGIFGRSREPRVVWAGIRDPDGRTAACVRMLREAVRGRGLPVEDRPFHPHLTLARIRDITRGHELTSAVQSATNTPCGEMEVRALNIYRSQLTRRGAHYTVLQEYLLTEGECRNG